jgi:hypothetical protein
VVSPTRKFDFGRELLKIIAIVTMVLDHIAAILYPDLLILHIIGRLAFPLFAYLVVLGVESTKKPRKYMATLLLFAVISQVPYYLAYVVLTAVGMKLLKDRPKLGVLALVALNLQFLFISGIENQIQILSLMAVPLIFLHIDNKLKKEITISENSLAYSTRKYFFYVFYPLHLALLFLIKMFLF